MGLDKEDWSIVIGYSLLSVGIWSWIIWFMLFFIYYEPVDPDRIIGTETPIIYQAPYIIKTGTPPVPIFVATLTATPLRRGH